MTWPHSVNAKSLLVLITANGVRVFTRYWLCKIKRSGSLRNQIVNYKFYEALFFSTKNLLSCQWVLYFLLRFNNIIEQIIILDLIYDFHLRIDYVVFILLAFDFSNEGYGFQN